MIVTNGPELLKWLHDELPSTNRVRFAVAFWGDQGFERTIALATTATEKKIICNLRMGGTNPREIRKLIQADAEVLHSDELHSKLFLLDSSGVIGSSNISSNGLSYQGKECKGWMETNIRFDFGPLYKKQRRPLIRFGNVESP